MLAQLTKIDQAGRVTLPQEALDALGLVPETEVVVELADQQIVIKPRQSTHPITERIAAMALPVANWEQLETEIESEHRAS